MSKRNQVNPDHYKIAGREPNGREVNQSLEKQRMTQADNPAQVVKPIRRKAAQLGKQKSAASPAAPRKTPNGKG